MVVAVVTPRGPITELDPRTNTIKLTREGFLFLDQLNRQVTDIASVLIIDTITDGIHDQAPSSNAVFDALALKADVSALSAYLTIAAAALGYQPLDSQLTSIAALADAVGVLTNDGAGVLSWAAAGTATITAWVDYTPTFTGFGTPSNVKASSRRVGANLEVRIKFTSGTSTATEGRISIGFNGTDGNVTSDGTVVSTIQYAGNGPLSYTGANFPTVLIESAVSYLTVGISNSARSGLTKVTGSTLLTSGDSISFSASIPISGWV